MARKPAVEKPAYTSAYTSALTFRYDGDDYVLRWGLYPTREWGRIARFKILPLASRTTWVHGHIDTENYLRRLPDYMGEGPDVGEYLDALTRAAQRAWRARERATGTKAAPRRPTAKRASSTKRRAR